MLFKRPVANVTVRFSPTKITGFSIERLVQLAAERRMDGRRQLFTMSSSYVGGLRIYVHSSIYPTSPIQVQPSTLSARFNRCRRYPKVQVMSLLARRDVLDAQSSSVITEAVEMFAADLTAAYRHWHTRGAPENVSHT